MGTTMWDRGRPLSLWGCLWNAIQSLRPAFSNAITFMWFSTVVAGMIVRVDLLGVTSIVRALNLRPELYHALLRLFHSTAVAFWTPQARPAHGPSMVPLRRRNGNQYLHRQSSSYRDQVKRKVSGHVFIQAGVVAPGLLQYLAVVAPKLVW